MKISLSRLLALALLSSACVDASAAPEASGRFESPAVGIALDVPAGWKTLAMRAIAPADDKERLPDAKLLAAIRPLAGKPLVELAKHPEPHSELNPTIQINLRPIGGFAGRPIEELMNTVVIPLRNQHPDLQLVGPAKQLKVSGLKAMQVTASYTLTVGPRQFKVRSHLWVVPRGALFFVIAMTQPPDGPDVAEREFQAALASIRIAP